MPEFEMKMTRAQSSSSRGCGEGSSSIESSRSNSTKFQAVNNMWTISFCLQSESFARAERESCKSTFNVGISCKHIFQCHGFAFWKIQSHAFAIPLSIVTSNAEFNFDRWFRANGWEKLACSMFVQKHNFKSKFKCSKIISKYAVWFDNIRIVLLLKNSVHVFLEIPDYSRRRIDDSFVVYCLNWRENLRNKPCFVW